MLSVVNKGKGTPPKALTIASLKIWENKISFLGPWSNSAGGIELCRSVLRFHQASWRQQLIKCSECLAKPSKHLKTISERVKLSYCFSWKGAEDFAAIWISNVLEKCLCYAASISKNGHGQAPIFSFETHTQTNGWNLKKLVKGTGLVTYLISPVKSSMKPPCTAIESR